jgi:hypothetical protein
MPKSLVCEFCRKEFVSNPSEPRQKFCSSSCRKRAWDKKLMYKKIRAAFNELVDKLEAGL